MTDPIERLAADFPDADDARWRALAEAALKGADFERALVRRTADGLARGPLFTTRPDPATLGAPGRAPFLRGLEPARDPYLPWGIRQRVAAPDPAAANAEILADLTGGVSEIELAVDPTGRTGAALRTLEDWARALDAVRLDLAPVHLDAGAHAADAAAALLALLDRQGLDLSQMRGGFGFSLEGPLAPGGVEPALQALAPLAAEARRAAPQMSAARVAAHRVHEAGGTEAQELGLAAAATAAWIEALIQAGLSADEAAMAVETSLAAAPDVHLTIAKLRAMRRIHARIAEAFGAGAEARGLRLRAITSARDLSRRDPYTNLIRAAAAGLAGAAGGADALTVRPFTEPLGAPSAFARRLARNLQILLQEESHIGRVADPAGGGYLHETLGESLAEAGWAQFQAIERAGGFAAALAADRFPAEVKAAARARAEALDTGKASLVGVTAYPVLDPERLDPVEPAPAPAPRDVPAAAGDTLAARAEAFANGAGLHPPAPDADGEDAGPFPQVRFAEPFEALAFAADRAAERTGERPAAFLATIGRQAEHAARAGFARTRLAVAGLACLEAEAHADPAACAEAFARSGARLAVIVGSDAGYAAAAAETAEALAAKGAEAIWLAGRPGEDAAALQAAGVTRFIHLRSALTDALGEALDVLGVPR